MPRLFATLHPKFKAPYFSIVIFGIVGAVVVLPGLAAGQQRIDLLGAVYSLAATFVSAQRKPLRCRGARRCQ